MSLLCADTGGTGCNKTYYRWDGGAWVDNSVTPVTAMEGSHLLEYYSDDQAVDALGDHNEEAIQSLTVKVDTTDPGVVLSSPTVDPTNGLIAVTAEFDEDVTGFINTDVTVVNGTVESFVAVDGNTYTFDVNPTDGASVAVTIDVLAAVADDIAGNDNTASNQLSYTSDTVPPTVAIGLGDDALKIGDTSLLTFTFSEEPTDFTVADIAAPNGALSGFTVTGNPLVYEALFTPTAGVEEPVNVVTVGTAWSDEAGNPPVGSTDSANYAIDTLAPSVILSSPTANPTNGLIAVTAEFSETVTGFDDTDISIVNSTVESFVAVDGNTYTFDVNPTDGASVAVTIDVPVTVAIDAAGNDSTASNQLAYTSDTVAPTLGIALGDSTLVADQTTVMTFTFSEAVTGFDNTDITVIENGTLTPVSSLDGGITWTGTFTPTADIEDITNVITVNLTGVADLATNAGVGTEDSANYEIDTLRPTVSITLGDDALMIGDTSLLTFTFSEVPTGFTAADVATPNGAIGAIDDTNPLIQTATFTPDADVEVATNVITVGTSWTDPAGNEPIGSTDSANYKVDTKRPTVVITLADYAIKAGDTPLVTFTFREAVTNFENADITVPNGSLAVIAIGDGGITWTATFTPTVDIENPLNVITVDMTALNDIAGNAGTGSTDSANFEIDTLLPTLSGVSIVSDNSDPTLAMVGDEATLTFTSSEDVVDPPVVTIDGQSALVTGGPTSWTATYTFTGTDVEGIVPFTIDFVDLAGNAGIQDITVDDATSILFDSTIPAVNAGTNKEVNVGTLQDAEISDAVPPAGSGLDTWTWSQVSGPGTANFSTVTDSDPALDPDVTVSADTDGTYVLKLTVTDHAGNSNEGTFTFIWDTTRPEPLTSNPSDGSTGVSTAAGTATVTFDEPIIWSGNGTRVFLVNDVTSASHKGTVSVSGLSPTVLNIDYTGLDYGTKYRINVKPNAVTDVATNGLLSNFISYFTTVIDTAVPVVNSLSAGSITTTGAVLSVTTDESATCKFATTDSAYSGMTAFDAPNTGTSHAATLTGLTPSTGYDYYVRCADTSAQTNTMTTSASVSFTTLTPDTTAPDITNIHTGTINQTSTTANWNTDELSDSQVEYGLTSSYGSTTSLTPTLVTGHTETLSGLTPGTLYHYRVKSRDAVGNLAVSGDNIFTTSAPDPDTSTPPVPSITTGTATVNSDSYTISGIADADTPAPTVRTISVYNGATLAGTAVVPVGQTGWSVSVTLTQSTANSFSAISADSSGNVSAASSAVVITEDGTVGADVTAPDVPAIMTSAATVDADTYAISGTAASDGGTRIITVYRNSAPVAVGTTVLAAGETSWSVVVPLNQSTTNTFTARSIDEVGNESVNSTSVIITEATVADTTAPVTSNIQATSISTSGATITWTTNENATSRVEYGLTSGYGTLSAADGSADNTSHSVALSSLTAGTMYHYRVVSADVLGNTAISTDNTFVTVIDDTATLAVTGIDTVRSFATADNTFGNGWRWTFRVTVPTGETSFAMKFDDFMSGANTIPVATNIRYYTAQSSANSASTTAVTIAGANAYSTAIILDSDADTSTAGRQINVTVEARVPVGTPSGSYSTSYGVASSI